MSRCQARQYSDQMMCGACGLTWDMNDPDPPICNNGVKVETIKPPKARESIETIKRLLGKNEGEGK